MFSCRYWTECLDGVIHRLTDGKYIPVQVKSRSETIEGMVQIVVPGGRLVDDHALLIAGLLTDDGLGACWSGDGLNDWSADEREVRRSTANHM